MNYFFSHFIFSGGKLSEKNCYVLLINTNSTDSHLQKKWVMPKPTKQGHSNFLDNNLLDNSCLQEEH
jgi:hypothetical protein